MRIIAELPHPDFKISILNMNQKFIVKILTDSLFGSALVGNDRNTRTPESRVERPSMAWNDRLLPHSACGFSETVNLKLIVNYMVYKIIVNC